MTDRRDFNRGKIYGTGSLRPGAPQTRPGAEPETPANRSVRGRGDAGAPASPRRGGQTSRARKDAPTDGGGRLLSKAIQIVAAKGAPMLVALFIASILLPMKIYAGPLLLPPYRLILLVCFVPLAIRLFSGKSGKVLPADKLMLAAGLWAVLAYLKNHGFSVMETAGLYMVEFFGAYLVGRVGVRSANDFRVLVKTLFVISLVLLPFAAAESITRRPVILDLFPMSLPPVDAGVRFGMRRAQTVFAHPIHYGAFVSMLFGLSWYVLDKDKSFVARWPKAIIAGVSTVFSLSTGALLGFMIQGILILYEAVMKANAKRWRIFGWGVVIGYVILDMIATKSPFHVLVHRLTFSSGSSYNRILIFQYGIENVKDNPLFGLGNHDWVRPTYMSASADNFWLLTAMKFGIPGFLFLALAVIWLIRNVSRSELTDPLARACRAGYLTALGGMILAGGTVHYWGNIFSFIVMVIGAGAWMAQPQPPSAQPTDAPDTEQSQRRKTRRSRETSE